MKTVVKYKHLRELPVISLQRLQTDFGFDIKHGVSLKGHTMVFWDSEYTTAVLGAFDEREFNSGDLVALQIVDLKLKLVWQNHSIKEQYKFVNSIGLQEGPAILSEWEVEHYCL